MADNSTNTRSNLSDILARCELFASLTGNDREQIAAGCEQRTLPPGVLLLAEGDPGNEMYILIEGVLEVFKRAGGEEVILQRHDTPGAHIGDKALVESSDHLRRASVRSLSQSHVLVVPKAVFRQVMQLNPAIEEQMSAVHHRQLKQLSLVERSVMYRALALFDQESGWSREARFEPGQLIVADGDPPAAVYVIRSGSVKRCRLDESGELVTLSVLRDGQTFGGLAVLEDRPHSAAAIAVTPVELVIFDREQFLEATASVPELHGYLGAVSRVYAMSGGLVTTFDGKFRGLPAIVTVVRLDNGGDVIVNHVIDRAIYSASMELPPDAVCEEYAYRDEKHRILRILTLHEGELVRVHAEGPWPELSGVHRLLLERATPSRDALAQFCASGHLLDSPPARLTVGSDAILCQCLELTRIGIESAIADGAATLEDLARETGATTVCGTCTVSIASLLQSTDQAVGLIEEIEVTPDVRSYRFSPVASGDDFGDGLRSEEADDRTEPEPLRPAYPGQHVVVSAEIDGNWVQRPYTITSTPGCTEWREITVKREDHGFLSNWLFKRPDDPRLRLSHPKGDFWIDPQRAETVVCLVAGIGMTPALAIARGIVEAGSSQTLYIDYSARTRVDFAYRPELDELAAQHANITVNYRATGGREHLDLEAVRAIRARLPNARFLVCGPSAYMEAARSMLLDAGVRPARIRMEVFTPTGHAPLALGPEHDKAKLPLAIVTIGLCALYLLQTTYDWAPSSLVALQQIDAYRIVTGSVLIALVGYQWYLPYLRWTRRLAASASRRHLFLGLLAPVALFFHSVSFGFAYTVVLSTLFVSNAIVGALDRNVFRHPEAHRTWHRFWLLAHVPASCVITALALIHMVYALAYK